jgi:hypothetical protein
VVNYSQNNLRSALWHMTDDRTSHKM